MTDPHDIGIPGLNVKLGTDDENEDEFIYSIRPGGLNFFNELIGVEIWWDHVSDGPVDGCSGSSCSWILEEKISEHVQYHPRDPIAEAKALFGCRKVSGEDTGLQAIVKLFVQ